MAILFTDVNLESNSVGSADLIHDMATIRASLFTIFATYQGERLFHPMFGSNLESLLFEPMDDTVSFYIKNEMLKGIEKWDSRIVVNMNASSVTPDYDNQVYKIVLVYSVPALEATDTLSFNLSKSN